MIPGRSPSDATHWRALRGVALLSTLVLGAAAGCASSGTSSKPGAEPGDCAARTEPLAPGVSRVSDGGYTFTLQTLEPSTPIQSDGPPGNHWTVTVTDPHGAPVTGAALLLTSYMPDHGHSGPPAAASEASDGSYDILDLVFPMPALYLVTLLLTLTDGQKQTVTLELCLHVESG